MACVEHSDLFKVTESVPQPKNEFSFPFFFFLFSLLFLFPPKGKKKQKKKKKEKEKKKKIHTGWLKRCKKKKIFFYRATPTQ